MSFKDQERLFVAAESVFLAQLLAEIERLAKLVIQTEQKAKEFTMAMGSVSFYCEWTEGEGDDFFNDDDYLHPSDLAESNCHAADLAEIFDNWNDTFRLTGHALRITMDHVTGELVAATDW